MKTDNKTIAQSVARALDARKATRDETLGQAVEHLVAGKELQSLGGVNAAELTTVSGSVARLFACNGVNATAVPVNVDTAAWLGHTEEDEDVRRCLVKCEQVYVPGGGFIKVNDGWTVVFMRDLLPRVTSDEEVVNILNDIAASLLPDGVVIVDNRCDVQDGNYEVDGVVNSERYEKLRPRLFERKLTVRADGEGYVFTERLTVRTTSDVHACSRQAGLFPVSGLGLDNTRFIAYSKKR